MSKAASLRYLPWLTRDVLTGPGVLYLVVCVVVTVIVWRLSNVAPDNLIDPTNFQAQFFGVAVMYCVLVATGGMVSGDLHNGFYRAWFSKPMAPWWYYLQRFVLGAAVLLLMPIVLGLGLHLVLGKGLGLSSDLFAGLGLAFLLIGGAVFLLSTITRRDWLAVFLVAFIQTTLGRVAASGVEFSPSLQFVHDVLPPFHKLGFGASMPAGSTLTHVAAYGGGMLVLALLVMRWRPMGSGGRA